MPTPYISAKAADRRLKTAEENVKKATAALEAAKLAHEEAALDALRARLAGPNQPPVGSDVRFDVTYRHDTKPYTYIALRTDEGWLLTGKRHEGKTYSWDEVLDIADRCVTPPVLQVRKPS